MKLLRIASSDIPLQVIDDRKYRLMAYSSIIYYTDCGAIHYRAYADYMTDGRSGGPVVDLILPNVGNKYYKRTWFPHDLAYGFAAECLSNHQEPPISFETANDLFEQALRLPKSLGGPGLGEFRAGLARAGIDSWIAKSGYDKIDGFDRRNFGKCKITWEDK